MCHCNRNAALAPTVAKVKRNVAVVLDDVGGDRLFRFVRWVDPSISQHSIRHLVIDDIFGQLFDQNFCYKGAYQESEPVYYVALQGDLSVPVTQENITRARISNAANGQSIAEWTSKDTGNDGGNITFPCGVVNRAGTYVLQLQYNGDQWIDHQELRVSWPPVLVQAPSELVNYRTAFNVKIQWIHLKCYPPVDANLTVLAQVVHCGLRDGNSSFSANCTAPLLRSTQLVPNFWQTGGVGTDVRFDCQTLDHPGYYRVYLREEQDDDHLIGTSDSIHVDLNEEFQLQVRAKFALPCHRELPVFYHRPACVTGAQDRVRVYGKTFASNFSSSDYTLNYIGEKILDPNRSVVALPCAMLDGWNFDLLCFTYVTLASSDGAVIDIIQTCIPNQNTSSMIQFIEEKKRTKNSVSVHLTQTNCLYSNALGNTISKSPPARIIYSRYTQYIYTAGWNFIRWTNRTLCVIYQATSRSKIVSQKQYIRTSISSMLPPPPPLLPPPHRVDKTALDCIYLPLWTYERDQFVFVVP